MSRPGAHAATVPVPHEPPPPRGTPRGGRRRGLRIALFVVGLGVLAAILATVGWKSGAVNLALIGPWFAALVALYAFAQLAFALGWWVLTGPAPRPVGFGELFAAYLGGDSINYFTSVGGEPVKAQLLKDRMGFSRALATVTVHRHADVLAQWLFLTAGVGFALAWFPLPTVARVAALASLVTLGAMVAGMTWGLRRGVFRGGLTWFGRFRPFAKHAARLSESAARLDATIGEFYREKTGHFGWAVAWCFVGWCGGLVETYLVLRLLSPTHGWATAIAIESLAMVLNNILLFIPGRVGSAEGVRIGVYALVGMTAAQGTAYALVRRGRELLWLVPGFVVLLRRHVLGVGPMAGAVPEIEATR
ncbi:MAG TPA: lysylphosphatidylglycerol synthase domain-containing protein [Thermoanaerobaculia bacterium]|nr:lysylphosphatidylglycerol synthase domain-containing protein [Thermoanaerobaculia bacterium]